MRQALNRQFSENFMIDDQILIERILKGDNVAFSQLTDKHLKKVISHAYRITGSIELAEDIAQDVFVKVWQKASMWDKNKAKFSTWLYQITYNQTIDYMRKNKYYLPIDEVSEKAVSYDAETLTNMEKEEQKQLLKQKINALPDRQKRALILCYFEDCSYKDAAKIMEISLSALESLLARARKTLKDEFAFS